MDVNVNDQDVLLAKEKYSDELKVVTGMEKDGKPKAVEPKPENEKDFLKIDKHGNVLDNFLSNFKRQYSDPTHFRFFKVPIDKLDEVVTKLQDALKKPEVPENKAFIDMHTVEPPANIKKNSIDESKVDWKQLEKLGLTKETLVKTNTLSAMLNWQKTPILLPVVMRIDDLTMKTDARLSLRPKGDGTFGIAVNALRKEPELDRPYFNIKFTDEDKKNLLISGNLGRVAEVEYKKGELTPVFISIDKLTNELVAIRTDRIKIFDEYKGIELNDTQKKELAEGKSIYLEKMIANSGKTFDGNVQVNADRRSLAHWFDQQPKQTQQQGQDEQKKQVHIKSELGGVTLTAQQNKDLREDKTIYVAGMKDREGNEYNAYVKVNHKEGKLDFFKYNPDKAKEITPDNASKTQVAVNSEGKTTEATKNIKEPLQKGQTQPTEKQAAKQEQKETQEKKVAKKGPKM